MFEVPAGSLAFSVSVYTATALVALCLLMFRRSSSACGYAELGGPKGAGMVSVGVMIGLWFIYITMSSLQAYGVIFPTPKK